MFHRDPHGVIRLTPTDCEDIARCAETHGVVVSFDPRGLKLSKVKHCLLGTVTDRRVIPWSIFEKHYCPAISIKADIQSLAAGIDRAIAEWRERA